MSPCIICICTHRHWKQLMKETGIEFDMNPDTFTLENLFAMELSRFNETIQTIVTSASKELQIEKVPFFSHLIVLRPLFIIGLCILMC